MAPRLRDVNKDPVPRDMPWHGPADAHVEGQGYEGRSLGPERGPEVMDPDDDD